MRIIDRTKVLAGLIDAYFSYIKGDCHLEEDEPSGTKATKKSSSKVVWDRPPEPATLTGLALFLGFKSMQEFEQYEQTGAYRGRLKQARLRVEAEYEKRLCQQAPTGAIFALKTMGWATKPDQITNGNINITLQILLTDTGYNIAGNEKDVLM